VTSDKLPASVRELVDILGMDTVLTLIRGLGGTTFPVPKRETKQGEVRYRMLVEVIGEEAADLVVYHYGGGDMYIPRCAKALQESRDVEINAEATAAIRAGKSTTVIVNELARKYGLTDRRVWDILKTLLKPDTQRLSLFCPEARDLID